VLDDTVGIYASVAISGSADNLLLELAMTECLGQTCGKDVPVVGSVLPLPISIINERIDFSGICPASPTPAPGPPTPAPGPPTPTPAPAGPTPAPTPLPDACDIVTAVAPLPSGLNCVADDFGGFAFKYIKSLKAAVPFTGPTIVDTTVTASFAVKPCDDPASIEMQISNTSPEASFSKAIEAGVTEQIPVPSASWPLVPASAGTSKSTVPWLRCAPPHSLTSLLAPLARLSQSVSWRTSVSPAVRKTSRWT
jgi:hypothetical protein